MLKCISWGVKQPFKNVTFVTFENRFSFPMYSISSDLILSPSVSSSTFVLVPSIFWTLVSSLKHTINTPAGPTTNAPKSPDEKKVFNALFHFRLLFHMMWNIGKYIIKRRTGLIWIMIVNIKWDISHFQKRTLCSLQGHLTLRSTWYELVIFTKDKKPIFDDFAKLKYCVTNKFCLLKKDTGESLMFIAILKKYR